MTVHVVSFAVCIVAKIVQDTEMVCKYCGVISTLFDCCLRVSSVHVLVFV